MKKKILIWCIYIFIIGAILVNSENEVKLELLCTIDYSSETFIPGEVPIWWMHIRPMNYDYEFSQDPNVAAYIKKAGFDEGYYAVSWGLPLKKLTYKYASRFSMPDDRFVGKVVFKNEEHKDTFYIYRMVKLGLVDEYLNNICMIPKITIE